ncbi:MASE4 domain-containing protein [Massilia sp. LjRoot122]|uniref:MASE4 domain-containing protein n=1 Tax=Massilia sp. LjRoot122 TaxID=3342257 RepID=UPI003ECDCDAB
MQSTFDGLRTTRPQSALAPFQRQALLAALAIGIVTACLMPFAAHKWPNVPAFVPSYQTALIGAYLVAAYLIHGYFKQTRLRAMLWLWGGCIYTAGVLVAQFLSLPNAFVADTRLLGGAQTTIWLWFFWHIGASGMLFAYALAELRRPGAQVAGAESGFLHCVLLTCAALGATLIAVTVFHDALPPMDSGGDFSAITRTGYAPLIQAIVMLALFMLWRATRFATPISAWLGVAMFALAIDNAITMAGGARLSIGWYVGRINALVSALVMLALYMKEVNRVYLNAALNAGELAAAKVELEHHQLHLESLVAERTRSLEEARDALLHAQKLEAVGKLTGGVAHDFNNVLHIINGNLDLIKMFAAGNEKILPRCASAQDAVRRGARLSSQLLSFARKLPLQPAPTSLAQVLSNMDVLLKRAVGERIDIDLQIDADAWNVIVDPQQLENAILNLTLNASDAMEGSGRLTIGVRNLVGADGEAVRISFADTGCGMTPEVRQRAFEPFFSTKEVGKGTGLGLSMVYGFVKQSGGQIDIESEAGQGATIVILLPRTPASAVDKKPAQPGEAVGGSETVLVVDDEAEIRANVSAMLSGLGYRILSAASADEARTVLEQHARIDLLFTDVIMPGATSSTRLAELARAAHPAIRVLFTSGYTEDAVIHDGKLAEGVSLLSKPYGRDELAHAVRSVLREGATAA